MNVHLGAYRRQRGCEPSRGGVAAPTLPGGQRWPDADWRTTPQAWREILALIERVRGRGCPAIVFTPALVAADRWDEDLFLLASRPDGEILALAPLNWGGESWIYREGDPVDWANRTRWKPHARSA